MKILLISESSTEDDIYRMIDQIIKIDKIIETHDISEELSYITDIRYDIIIINLYYSRLCRVKWLKAT